MDTKSSPQPRDHDDTASTSNQTDPYPDYDQSAFATLPITAEGLKARLGEFGWFHSDNFAGTALALSTADVNYEALATVFDSKLRNMAGKLLPVTQRGVEYDDPLATGMLIIKCGEMLKDLISQDPVLSRSIVAQPSMSTWSTIQEAHKDAVMRKVQSHPEALESSIRTFGSRFHRTYIAPFSSPFPRIDLTEFSKVEPFTMARMRVLVEEHRSAVLLVAESDGVGPAFDDFCDTSPHEDATARMTEWAEQLSDTAREDLLNNRKEAAFGYATELADQIENYSPDLWHLRENLVEKIQEEVNRVFQGNLSPERDPYNIRTLAERVYREYKLHDRAEAFAPSDPAPVDTDMPVSD